MNDSVVELPTLAGKRVAWVEKRRVGGVRITRDVSQVHRALTQSQTYCGQRIAPINDHIEAWPTLETCRRCDRFHKLGLTAADVQREDVRQAMRTISDD